MRPSFLLLGGGGRPCFLIDGEISRLEEEHKITSKTCEASIWTKAEHKRSTLSNRSEMSAVFSPETDLPFKTCQSPLVVFLVKFPSAQKRPGLGAE